MPSRQVQGVQAVGDLLTADRDPSMCQVHRRGSILYSFIYICLLVSFVSLFCFSFPAFYDWREQQCLRCVLRGQVANLLKISLALLLLCVPCATNRVLL